MIQQFLVYGPSRNYLDIVVVNTAEGEEITADGTSGTIQYTITTTANGMYESISQDLSTNYHVEYHSDQKDILSVAEEFVFANPEEAYESYIIGQPLAAGGSYFDLSYFPKSPKSEGYEFVEESEPRVEFLMEDGVKHEVKPGENTGLKFTKVEASDPMWGKLDTEYIDCETFLCSAWKMDLDEKHWKVKYEGEVPLKIVITGVNKIDIGGRRRSSSSSIEEAETTFYTPGAKPNYLFLEIFLPVLAFLGCCCCGIFGCLCFTVLIVVGCSLYSLLCVGTGVVGGEISSKHTEDEELLMTEEKKDGYKSTMFVDHQGEV